MTDDERYADLLANVKAVEIVVRTLFATWALHEADPRAAAFRSIERMIGSLHRNKQGIVPEARRAFQLIEDHLRHFHEAVDARLAAVGQNDRTDH
jgi:hypothetical protein